MFFSPKRLARTPTPNSGRRRSSTGFSGSFDNQSMSPPPLIPVQNDPNNRSVLRSTSCLTPHGQSQAGKSFGGLTSVVTQTVHTYVTGVTRTSFLTTSRSRPSSASKTGNRKVIRRESTTESWGTRPASAQQCKTILIPRCTHAHTRAVRKINH